MLRQKNPSKASPIRATLPVAEHPFLIVRRRNYTSLQTRATRSPWKEQKAAALLQAKELVCDPAAGIRAWSQMLARIFSTAALAYILDPQNRPIYRDRIVEHLRFFDASHSPSMIAQMRANGDKMLWIYGVPTGNAFFQGVLALDVIHDDLSADQLQEIEGFLRDGPADYFMRTELVWRQGGLAAKAIWPLYKGNASVFEPIVEEWYEDTLSHISTDGVFTGGTGYAAARWTQADREHKALFGEVLAHVGLLRGWYEEPRLQNFQEWINSYAYTPFRIYWTFGDSGPSGFDSQLQPGPERACRYTELAGKYAAWLSQGATPYVGLGSYVLAEEPYPTAVAAPSRIFADGGAWLKQTSLDPNSLSAVLWNLTDTQDAHAHKETNSLGIAAYGEMLLRASGYNAWAEGEAGFSWDYIHDRAISANTVLFDYQIPNTEAEEQNPSSVNDHVKKSGAGTIASLLNGFVDYAKGDSGDAIPNGRHLRNFLFVHPADSAAGYYVVIDELIPQTPGSTAHVIWHPSSNNYIQTVENQEFTWTSREFSDAKVCLTLFLGTTPAKCAVRNGVLANWGKGLVGKYLACDYSTGFSASTNVLTVLFPHNATHPKAEFSRVANSGVVVRQGDVEDYIFESSGKELMDIAPGVLAQARAGVIRRSTGPGLLSLWLMDAVRFVSDELEFESTAPVVVFRREQQLYIATTVKCRLVFKQMGLQSIIANGEKVDPRCIMFAPGAHLLQLI